MLLYIDFLDDIHDRSDSAVLPRVNPYENYDEKEIPRAISSVEVSRIASTL